MIGPGSLVRCLDRDGVFTTRGREQPWPAGKVEEVGPPW